MSSKKDLEPKNGFKIIAVKTLPDCDRRFLKVLKPDTVYYFYNNYNIDPETDKISSEDSLTYGLYNVNGLEINLSAIVGKNGSGKSAIIELIFRAINNFSCKQKFKKIKFEELEGLHLAIYYYLGETYHKMEFIGKDFFLTKYNSNGSLGRRTRRNPAMPEFFYTIAVNYSHYAYNVNDYEEGDWIDSFFHKNDGYQTPIVINPFRNNGDIEVNIEADLLQSRLLSNLVLPSSASSFSFRKISETLEAYKVVLTLKESKSDKELWRVVRKGKSPVIYTISDLENQRDRIYKSLDKLHPFKNDYLDESYRLAKDYILYKLVKICLNYPDYNQFFSKKDKQFDPLMIDEFLKKLMNDGSHITFKLKQTLNFLLFQQYELKSQVILLTDLEKNLEIAREKYSKTILDTIEMLPPPIFKTEIVLKRIDQKESEDISLKTLSSGEKQIIYSVNSIIYHLVNLNSIKKGSGKRKYENISLILEEIELYFHPEMQRGYVSYLLDALSRVKLEEIKCINFCFVTHSPFILSDIPSTNILFLQEDGRPIEKEKGFMTFGANIHDLLKQSFFLKNGSMGDFATKKITDTINYLHWCRNKKELKEMKESKIVKDDILKIKEREVKESEHEVIVLESTTHKNLIEIIDEPILKRKLSQLYDEYHQTDMELRLIHEKIALLQSQAEALTSPN